MSKEKMLAVGSEVSGDTSRVMALGAYALAPTLFQDPRFRAAYDREYQKIEDWNSFVEKVNPISRNVRNELNNALRGIMAFDEKGVDLESFDEASLNEQENLGTMILNVLQDAPALYSEYERMLLDAGKTFIAQKCSQRTRPMLTE